MQTKPHVTHYRFKNSTPYSKVKKVLKEIQKGNHDLESFSDALLDNFSIRVAGVDPAPKGGVTIVKNMDTGDTAIAICGAKEHFCRRTGRLTATERLQKNP